MLHEELNKRGLHRSDILLDPVFPELAKLKPNNKTQFDVMLSFERQLALMLTRTFPNFNALKLLFAV